MEARILFHEIGFTFMNFLLLNKKNSRRGYYPGEKVMPPRTVKA
jgi:hypothetical protein